MADDTSSIPDLETQKNEITRISRKILIRYDTWFLIDHKWYKQWKKYVGYDNWETANVGDSTTHPGPIDNSPLLRDDGSGEIKDHLIDELDYILLPKEAWDLLVQSYGLTEGQLPIARKVVEYGMFVKHCKVEVYLLDFKLSSNKDLDHVVIKKFSKSDTIGYIEQEMRTIFNIPEESEIRIWNRYSHNTYEQLINKEVTVQDTGLYHNQVLIIEEQNEDGSWPRQTKNTNSALYNYSSSSASGDTRGYNNQQSSMATRSYSNVNCSNYRDSQYRYGYVDNSSSVTPGLCGLNNLGNTCFMNSALQCMSNTPPVVDYFYHDQYQAELNTENPLGMKGEIANSFGELVKAMWSGRYSYTVPRNFKMIVGRFAPQFSGYQQQDCQELMAFLLDGLHEDLNRVKKKPYIEQSDTDGRLDEHVAEEAWNNYLKRNNSIIVDIFHGLLKSTLVCPECAKVSVTFDPFCYLSLPLPIKKERLVEILMVFADPTLRHSKMKISVPKLGNIQDFCEVVQKVFHIPANNLIVADVYNHRLHKVFSRDDLISSIMDRDEIFVYETISEDDVGEPVQMLPIYLKHKKSTASSLLFGHPLFVPVPEKSCSYDKLHSIIVQQMSRFLKVPQSEDDWETLRSPVSEKQNGEIEMTNGEECDSEKSEIEKENEDEMDVEDKVRKNKQNYLFRIHSVNACGNVFMKDFLHEKEISLEKKLYLAAEFEERIKEKCFNEREMQAFTLHENTGIRSQKKQIIQLSECLELFTTVEKLGADDPWYCPSCKQHQQATKKFDLWSLPQVLIIHLKRFSYNRYWRDKLDTMVDFPVTGLNMEKYVLNPSHGPALYDLIAVANHYGGMGGGHYTAYGKNSSTGSWYYFDDSSVSSVTEDTVVSKAAYVLFYMRRGDPVNHPHSGRQGPSAALGAPVTDEEDNSLSDEDTSMDVN